MINMKTLIAHLCLQLLYALTVHDGGTLLVRAQPTSHDDDVMYVAPVPLRPQDVDDLNKQIQEVEGVRKRRYTDDEVRPAFTDDLDDTKSASSSLKRAVSMLRMGKRRASAPQMERSQFDDNVSGVKRAVSMLRMGRAAAADSHDKRAVSMLRMGRGFDDNESAAYKKAVGMLRMGRNYGYDDETSADNKRAVGMLRMGRALDGKEAEKKAVSMLRMGRNEDINENHEKRAVGMLRMGRNVEEDKRAVSMLRMGRRQPNNEKKAVGMLRMGRGAEEDDKRAVSMLRMGRREGDKRAVGMLRMGRSGNYAKQAEEQAESN